MNVRIISELVKLKFNFKQEVNQIISGELKIIFTDLYTFYYFYLPNFMLFVGNSVIIFQVLFYLLQKLYPSYIKQNYEEYQVFKT